MLDKTLLRGDILEALSRTPPAEEDLRLMLEVAFPADIAEIIADLDPDARLLLIRQMDPDDAGEAIHALPEPVARDVLTDLITRRRAARILNEMEPDDGADLMDLLSDEHAERALSEMEPEQAEAIRSLAEYDPETAGGRMTTEYVTAQPDERVGDVLARLQTSTEIEAISNVYVTDHDGQIDGVLSMREVLESPPDAPVSDVMTKDVITTHVDTDQEEAGRLFDRYDVASLPVVDDHDRLIGVITYDDAIDVLDEEAEEDMQLISGSGDVGVRDSAMRHIRMRLPWLLVTLGGGFLAAILVRHYDATLEQVSTLVIFMPVMAGMAGNVGIQSSTVLVRGFATGEMVMGLAARTVVSQFFVGAVVGCVCGLLTGVIAYSFEGDRRLGFAVAVSMMAGTTNAAVIGTLLPILCKRFKVDPAMAAGPFVTMLNDLVGLFIYFTVATLILL
jgi:magnesium transporter